jgi:thioredoxin
MALQITKENFEAEVLKADKPVLVDFWAPWCGPCKMLGPIVEELSEELSGTVVVAKINIDEEPDLATQYGVMSIPTMIVFENGEVKKQTVGFMPKEKIKEALGI